MNRKRTLRASMILMIVLVSLTTLVRASEGLERAVQAYIETSLAGQTDALQGRVEIKVGTLDPRLTLAPCDRIEPYLPPSARLWGRAHIGIRCLEGPKRWNVYLPIEVKVFGPALVAARPLASGQTVGAGDYRSEEVEFTREAPGVIIDPAQVESKITARPITPGSALRIEHFRPKSVIAAGDQVKVVFVGTGFTIASEGKALAAAADGQTLRVQMESGRIISGTARDGRRVELH